MPDELKYSEDQNNFFLNEENKKKQELLREKYGMKSFTSNKETTPEIENNFLNYVEQFEEAWEHAVSKKVKEILGNHEFTSLETIDKEDLSDLIDMVLDTYEEYSIRVSVTDEEELVDEEFYRFLTEELPEHETQFIEIEGMTTNFIYEEFHRTDRLDSKDSIRFFLDSLVGWNPEYIKIWISNNGVMLNGNLCDLNALISYLSSIFPKKIENGKINYLNFDLSDPFKVDIEYSYGYEEILCGAAISKHDRLKLTFILERSNLGGFEVSGIISQL